MMQIVLIILISALIAYGIMAIRQKPVFAIITATLIVTIETNVRMFVSLGYFDPFMLIGTINLILISSASAYLGTFIYKKTR